MLYTRVVENQTGFSRLCWELDDLRCVLTVEGGSLEIQLFHERKLVAMWPCSDWAEAFSLASAWKLEPPRWWPPADIPV